MAGKDNVELIVWCDDTNKEGKVVTTDDQEVPVFKDDREWRDDVVDVEEAVVWDDGKSAEVMAEKVDNDLVVGGDSWSEERVIGIKDHEVAIV